MKLLCIEGCQRTIRDCLMLNRVEQSQEVAIQIQLDITKAVLNQSLHLGQLIQK